MHTVKVKTFKNSLEKLKITGKIVKNARKIV